MNTLKVAVFLIITLFLHSCSPASMTGSVVDAETGKPIDGAVIHAHWSITKGIPGLSYGQDYNTAEAVTDKDGKFKLSGVLNPFVNPPIIVVYKKGYVAWRNDYLFPGYQRREGFQWQDGNVFKLERFKKYSHDRHIMFIDGGLSLTSSSKLQQAFSEEDIVFAGKERTLLSKKLPELKQGKKTEEQIWQEIIDELYSHKGDSK
jgi:hypothetical protein